MVPHISSGDTGLADPSEFIVGGLGFRFPPGDAGPVTTGGTWFILLNEVKPRNFKC